MAKKLVVYFLLCFNRIFYWLLHFKKKYLKLLHLNIRDEFKFQQKLVWI